MKSEWAAGHARIEVRKTGPRERHAAALALLGQVHRLLQEPEMIAGVWQAAKAREQEVLDEPAVLVAMRQMEMVWEHVKTSFDVPLVGMLGKAFYWQRLVDAGELANAHELVRRLKLEPEWVSEGMRMTRLAPDIVQAILDGRQPRYLNLHAMRGRQVDVPAEWQAQRVLFGFAMANPE